MSSDKPSILPPQQPSEEQEREILAWTLKERHRGAVVRKELIHWFAEGVIRHDGAKTRSPPASSKASSIAIRTSQRRWSSRRSRAIKGRKRKMSLEEDSVASRK